MPAPVTAPTTTPVTTPSESPLWETYTDPEKICPQQTEELASPDVAP